MFIFLKSFKFNHIDCTLSNMLLKMSCIIEYVVIMLYFYINNLFLWQQNSLNFKSMTATITCTIISRLVPVSTNYLHCSISNVISNFNTTFFYIYNQCILSLELRPSYSWKASLCDWEEHISKHCTKKGKCLTEWYEQQITCRCYESLVYMQIVPKLYFNHKFNGLPAFWKFKTIVSLYILYCYCFIVHFATFIKKDKCCYCINFLPYN